MRAPAASMEEAPNNEAPEVGEGDVVEETVALVELPPAEGVALERVMLAQARRVSSLRWMTMERLPMKDLSPLTSER
jgi:hypothetical protein